MAGSPGILLMDEPLSALDAELRIEMRQEIASLHRRHGSTFIYVTHKRIPQDLERIGKAGQTVVGNLPVQFENGSLELPQRVACPAGLASAV